MTVTTTLSTKQYSGNGSTTVFAFPYKIIDGAHFVVSTLISATNVMTIHTKDGSGTYDYTVAVAADLESANVTFLTAPPTGYEITIDRQTTKTQPTDYTPNDDFPAETHERALDRATLLHQDLNNDYKNNAILFDPNTLIKAGVILLRLSVRVCLFFPSPSPRDQGATRIPVSAFKQKQTTQPNKNKTSQLQ